MGFRSHLMREKDDWSKSHTRMTCCIERALVRLYQKLYYDYETWWWQYHTLGFFLFSFNKEVGECSRTKAVSTKLALQWEATG